MANESDVAAAYQAALDAQAAAEAAYQAAVDVHGPHPDASLPESENARWLEWQADGAWDAYREAWAAWRFPEATADSEAYLDQLDQELGADPHHEIDTELDNHLEAEWAEQIREQHAEAAAEAEVDVWDRSL